MKWFRQALAAVPMLSMTAFAPVTLAHEGGVDARGAVVEISTSRIMLDTETGERRSFVVTADTEIRRGTTPVKASDVTAGEKAVVHARKAHRGDPEATSIRLSKTPAAKR